MPTYDVSCASCDYHALVCLKIKELPAWDAGAVCPQCSASREQFHRVIAGTLASRPNARGLQAQLTANKQRFARSGERDDMRHKASLRSNKDEVKAARESLKRGEFEGF